MFVIIFTTKIKPQVNFIAGRREVLFIFLELYGVLEIVHINVCTVGVVDIHDHHQHYNLKRHALQGGLQNITSEQVFAPDAQVVGQDN